jgi:pyridoxine 5'-phosphate synthase PdxJ
MEEHISEDDIGILGILLELQVNLEMVPLML